MFKKIFAWFTGEVQSVENILKGFFGTIAALEQHAEDKFKEATDYNQIAAGAQELEAKAKAEGQTAAEVAEKIKGIVS